MKRYLFLASIFAMMAMASAVSAQKATDFSGTWALDVAKSKPAEMMIESQTLTVTQSATEIKAERATKRKEMPAGTSMPGMGGGGGGRGFGGGDGAQVYGIGTAAKSQMQTQMGAIDVTSTAKIDGSSATLSRTFTTPNGDRTMSEKWTLNADGTLTVESSRPNRDGGTDTTVRTYKKS